MGNPLRLNLVALRETSGNPEAFAAFAAAAAAQTPLALVLWSESPDCLRAALEKVGDRKPLLYPATDANHAAVLDLARRSGCPVGLKASGPDALAALAEGRSTLRGWLRLASSSQPCG